MAQKHRYAKSKKKAPKKKQHFLKHISFLIPFVGEEEKLPKWESILILSLSLLAAGYLINDRITEYSSYIHVSDEVDNMRAIECLVQEGEIIAGMPSTYAYTPNFEINGGQFEYWVETILRVPGYLIWKDSELNWGAYSGFWYFFLIGVVLIGFLALRKKNKFPVLSISFLMVLLAYSTWSSASFYFVRYYVFLMYGFLLCQFIATQLLQIKPHIPYTHYAAILLISFLPAIFHKIGYLAVFVWVGIIGVDIFSKHRLKDLIVTKNLKWMLLVGVMAFLGILFFWPKMSYYLSSGMVDISWKIGPGIEKFIQLSMDPSWVSYLLIGTTVLGGVLCYNFLSKYERTLLLCNTAFFLFSFFVLMFFMAGKQYVFFDGYNRYAFISHISFLFELGLLATAIIKFIYAKVPAFPAKGITMMGSVLLIFLLGIFPKSQLDLLEMNFSMRPRLTHESINKVKNQINQASPEKAIIVTNQGFVETAFQEYPVFFLTPPPKEAYTFTGEGGGIYAKSRRGYVGTEAAFCQMLSQYPGRGVFYFYIEEKKAAPQLLQKLKQHDMIKELVIRPGDNIKSILCR